MAVGMETRGGGRAAVALRVLVIDATQGRGELMAQHLRAEGMQPTVVASAQDAWNLLEWTPADVVLLRAGGDMAEACEMAPALARRGVVLVTASAEPVRPDVRRRALAAGVQDMLVAPFDAREMAARLDAATFDAGAAEAAPEVGRPRVPMAAAVDDDAKTRAEARPAALVAEEVRPQPRRVEPAGDAPTRAEPGLPAALVADEAPPRVADEAPPRVADEAPPRVARPAASDDPRTQAEAGPPAALLAESGGTGDGRGAEAAAKRPASVDAAPAAGADRESLAELSALAGLEGGGEDDAALTGGALSEPPRAVGAAPERHEEAARGVGASSSGMDVGEAVGARAVEPFDAMGALSESGLLNWLGDEDDMPGAIPAEGWHGGEDLTASEDFEQLMTGDYPDPMLDDLEAEVDAQIEAEAARLGAARSGERSAGGQGPESGMAALRMDAEDAPHDDPFGFGRGGTQEGQAKSAGDRGSHEQAAEGQAPAAPRMDVEPAELEVGPGTRDVLATGFGRARREKLMWRTATAMMGTVLLGLVGIVGWKLLAAPAGTPPEAGLVAGQAPGGEPGAEGTAGAGQGQGAAAGLAAAGPRETEAPEPSSVAESNALLFGEAVTALGAGWPDDADDRFRLLLRNDPTDRRAMAGLATSLAQQGEFEAARAMLDTLAEQPESEPGALLTLGLVAHRLGDTEGARRGLERFVEAAPKDPRAEQVRRLLASLSAG
jgi:DNA-binding response OmpR family regulator/TolA-binding protein